MSKKTILVTGGAGFIGSNLIEILLGQSHKVICLDNFNDYYDLLFKIKNVERFKENTNFVLVKGDIRDQKVVNKVFQENQIKVVINLAAMAGVGLSIEKPHLYFETNALAVINLLEASIKNKVTQFIEISSASVYGNAKLPFREDDPCITPLSPYGASKRCAELICYTYNQIYGLPITCLRLFNVYGKWGRPDAAYYKFTKAILTGGELELRGKGNATRDMTHVSDVVNGILKTMEKKPSFEIINLVASRPIKVKYLLELIEKYADKTAKIKLAPLGKEEILRVKGSNLKAKKVLGWQPRVKIEEGVKDFVEWYIKERL